MDEPYSGICGITKDELLTQMNHDIDALAERLSLNREQTIEALKENYDGYHFTWPGCDVFNPFSLLSCFAEGKIDTYWFGTGTPTYLIEMMKKFDVLPADMGADTEADKNDFDAATETMTTIMPLLYQSGYLTIKDYDAETQLYTLGIPNNEIRVGLYRNSPASFPCRRHTKRQYHNCKDVGTHQPQRHGRSIKHATNVSRHRARLQQHRL